MISLVRILVALSAASLLAASGAVAQQLYKYMGPDGRIHYTDRPPADARNAEKVTSHGGTISSGSAPAAQGGEGVKASGPKSLAEQEQQFRQRRNDAEEKARKDDKLAADKEQRTEACAGMQRELAGMQSGARVGRITENGERVYLEDAQVDQQIARLQRDITANCK